jgi:hypothetical protein
VKVKLDENIPVMLVEALTLLGHDVQTVIGQGLTGKNGSRDLEAMSA